jgi:hypothetical protein
MNILVTLIYFILIITWSLAYGCGKQWINGNKKCRQIAGDFDGHGDAAVRCEAHHPMEHIQGFTQSHWMLPSGECLRHIAPAAVIVDEFVETTQNTTMTQLLSSNYGTFRALVVCENLVPQNESSTQLIDATSCVKIWNTTIGAEELANISSYQTLSADKIWKSYKPITKLVL